MKIKCAAISDQGLRKNVNQDALLLKTGKIGKASVCLAVVCDGIGGLSKGEKASADCVRRLDVWVHERLPEILETNKKEKQRRTIRRGTELNMREITTKSLSQIRSEWEYLANEMDQRLAGYGRLHDMQLGSTLLALLVIDHSYLLMHVGDCRCYLHSVWKSEETRENVVAENDLNQRHSNVSLRCLTKDQTYLRRCIEVEGMAREAALADPHRYALSQCIGQGVGVEPEFISGQITGATDILLCSDGFWKRLQREQLGRIFASRKFAGEKALEKRLRTAVNINREAGERDDSSAILLCFGK